MQPFPCFRHFFVTFELLSSYFSRYFRVDPQSPRGPCDRKNSIPIENFNPGSKISIPIEIFKRDRKFQSRIFHLRGPHSVQKRARSKISIHDRSLEIFNPEGCDRIFSIPGPSGVTSSLLCVFRGVGRCGAFSNLPLTATWVRIELNAPSRRSATFRAGPEGVSTGKN